MLKPTFSLRAAPTSGGVQQVGHLHYHTDIDVGDQTPLLVIEGARVIATTCVPILFG